MRVYGCGIARFEFVDVDDEHKQEPPSFDDPLDRAPQVFVVVRNYANAVGLQVAILRVSEEVHAALDVVNPIDGFFAGGEQEWSGDATASGRGDHLHLGSKFWGFRSCRTAGADVSTSSATAIPLREDGRGAGREPLPASAAELFLRSSVKFVGRVAFLSVQAMRFLYDHNRGHCDIMAENFMLETERVFEEEEPPGARDNKDVTVRSLFGETTRFVLHVIDTEQMAACSFFNRSQIPKDLVRLAQILFFALRVLVAPGYLLASKAFRATGGPRTAVNATGLPGLPQRLHNFFSTPIHDFLQDVSQEVMLRDSISPEKMLTSHWFSTVISLEKVLAGGREKLVREDVLNGVHGDKKNYSSSQEEVVGEGSVERRPADLEPFVELERIALRLFELFAYLAETGLALWAEATEAASSEDGSEKSRRRELRRARSGAMLEDLLLALSELLAQPVLAQEKSLCLDDHVESSSGGETPADDHSAALSEPENEVVSFLRLHGWSQEELKQQNVLREEAPSAPGMFSTRRTTYFLTGLAGSRKDAVATTLQAEWDRIGHYSGDLGVWERAATFSPNFGSGTLWSAPYERDWCHAFQHDSSCARERDFWGKGASVRPLKWPRFTERSREIETRSYFQLGKTVDVKPLLQIGHATQLTVDLPASLEDLRGKKQEKDDPMQTKKTSAASRGLLLFVKSGTPHFISFSL